MARVLVVGAGPTGGLLAALLGRRPPGPTPARPLLWDRARGAGGRMATSRSPYNSRCTADLGAQYLTLTPQYAERHRSFYDELLANGVLKPLTSTIEGMVVKEGECNFVAPQGISSIVKYFLRESGVDVFYEHCVTKIFLRSGKWEVHRERGPAEEFDVVILTIPVPQILQLQGDIVNMDMLQPPRRSKAIRGITLAISCFFSFGSQAAEPEGGPKPSGVESCTAGKKKKKDRGQCNKS